LAFCMENPILWLFCMKSKFLVLSCSIKRYILYSIFVIRHFFGGRRAVAHISRFHMQLVQSTIFWDSRTSFLKSCGRSVRCECLESGCLNFGCTSSSALDFEIRVIISSLAFKHVSKYCKVYNFHFFRPTFSKFNK
jgi:hypothetical protein